MSFNLIQMYILEGIVIDPEDRTYRNSNTNSVFGLINSFIGDNDGMNKKRTK